jgi:hypothetical protein
MIKLTMAGMMLRANNQRHEKPSQLITTSDATLASR